MVDAQKHFNVLPSGDSRMSAADKMQLMKQQEKLKTILENSKENSIENSAAPSRNLFEHVVDVMDFLIINYPREAIEKIEEVSFAIKQGDINQLNRFLLTEDKRPYAKPGCETRISTTSGHVEAVKSLFNVSFCFNNSSWKLMIFLI